MPTGDKQIARARLTDQQHRAIAARGASVALSAGAGCGKTFVLTERFLAELEPDTKPRPSVAPRTAITGRGFAGIVAITFTERAAREMRNRIRAACRRRLLECPDEQATYWLELVRDLDSARISTIHAFCASLLRAHAVEAGLDPRFRVLDGAQAGTLLFELTDELLRERLAERDEMALNLVTRFGLGRLREMVDRLLAVRQAIDWAAWRGETPEGLAARWEAFWRSDTVPRALRAIAESSAAWTVLDVAQRCPPRPPKMRERCDFLVEHLPKLVASAKPSADLAAIREAAKVQGGATKNTWGDKAAFERFRDAAKELRDAIDGAAGRMAFDAVAARPAAALGLEALAMAADLSEQYDRRKAELAVLDFNDLLIRARELLVGAERGGLRKRLASQIRLLLVDEFQDTDPLQVEMVKALCDNEHLRGKLFFVGDYKQSIYRFRGAQPDVFRRLREEVPGAGQLSLSLNFRSQPAILDFVNALFAEELGPGYEPLQAHRPQVSPTPAIEFLWASDGGAMGENAPDEARPPVAALAETDDAMPARERLRRREADWIARRIRSMLDQREKIVWDDAADPPATRAAKPGDFAVLFRALTDVEYYEEALRRYGIDYYLVGGHAFYAQQEIYDLLNLLRAINSPCDVVSLVGTLRSPMFALLDESLFWLSRHPGGLAAGLFDGASPVELEPEQRRRAEFAAATLGALRAMKDRLPVAQLIHEALERTGYDAMLLAEFMGERKLANLHKLIEQARSFDRAGIFTLSDFITQLAEFVARQPDEPLAATHPESTDVVKLMTIHQSKGLEFPVVIVPDVGRPRRVMGSSVAFTPELGPLIKDADATTGYDLWTAAENDEDRAETNRLLYVATTRAADYLILSAGVDQEEKTPGPWREMLGRRFDLISGDTLAASPNAPRLRSRGTADRADDANDLLSSGTRAGRVAVRVTTAEPAIASRPIDLRRRRDLMKIVEKARQMAADGSGRRPRYVGPVPHDPRARRQFSFSRLSGGLAARTAGVEADAFDNDAPAEPPLDARGMGTLVHAVLADLDFARPGDVGELVRRHAEEHEVRGERLNEATAMIEHFVASPRAAALAEATERHAELEFLLAWPHKADGARGLSQFLWQDATKMGLSPSAPPYLQGFIDCLYRDAEGRWRIVDYKTNRATAENLSEKAAPYEMQMLVYALAAETILGTPPVELALCFLRPGVEHRFAWDAAAHRRAIELVNGNLP